MSGFGFLDSAPDNLIASVVNSFTGSGGDMNAGNFVKPFTAPKINGEQANPDPYYMRSMARYAAMHPTTSGAAPHGGRGRAVTGRMAQSLGFGGGAPENMDVDKMNQMLAPYGQQMPTHVNPFLMFNDQNAQGEPSWAGRHPRIAKGIEGALLGAQVPQGETTGENIANIARTIMGIPQAYKANRAAQFQASFDAARQMGDLQKLTDEHLNSEAEQRKNNAMADYYKRPLKHFNPADVMSDEAGGNFAMDEFTGDVQGVGGTTGQPHGKLTKMGTAKIGGISNLKTLEERQAATKAEALGYKDVSEVPADVWHKLVANEVAGVAGSRGAGGTSGRKTTEYGLGDLSQAEHDQLSAIDKDADESVKQLRSQKLPGIDDLAKDPNAIMNWDQTRQQRIQDILDKRDKAKQDFYKNRTGSGNLPKPQAAKSAAPSGRKRPTVSIRPDGTIAIE
jgi:hypothetical protein